MAHITDEDRLRSLLGEEIPPDGGEEDTLFTNDQITDLLERGGGDLDRAAFEGWRSKAAQLANLVDVTDGNASRNLSDLLENADKMIRYYQRSSAGPTEGRTRIGRIVRS